MKRFICLALFCVSGCGIQPIAPPLPLPAPEADSCEAAPYAHLIGAPATALERELIMRQIRILRPGQPMTMDYRAERLNIEIGPDERIVRLFCG